MELTKSQIFSEGSTKISYRVLGQDIQKPSRKIIFFHGFPGSSSQIEAFREHFENFNIQVLCMDRPGYNESFSSEPEQFKATTKALGKLIQHLSWTDFELISVSGGTPFLFDFGRSHINKIKRISILSGLGPLGHKKFAEIAGQKTTRSLLLFSLIPAKFLQLLSNFRPKNPGIKQIAFIRKMMPISKPDQLVMQDSRTQVVLRNSISEALAQAGRGPQRDAKSFLNNWSLDLPGYKAPIAIWHGSEDKIVPPETAELMAKLLNTKNLFLIPDQGHYSLTINLISQVLAKLD